MLAVAYIWGPPPAFRGDFVSLRRSPPRAPARRRTPPSEGLHLFVAGLNFATSERVYILCNRLRAMACNYNLALGFGKYLEDIEDHSKVPFTIAEAYVCMCASVLSWYEVFCEQNESNESAMLL